MKFLAAFVALLLLIGLLSATSASLIDAAITLTVADPATTTTNGSFTGLHNCIKDQAEDHAYCGSFSGYVVKLSLDPSLSFSAEFETDSGESVVSVALYEGTGSSRLFYNDEGPIKYVDAVSFGGLPTHTTVDNSAVSSSYVVPYYGHVLLDATNNIIYVGGTGKIYKIINVDSTPVFSSDVIDLADSNYKAGDLILANGDLYVAAAEEAPGKVSRITSPETSSANASKTVTFTSADANTYIYKCLHHVGDFIYATTSKYGIIVKMSIGSTDDDFAVVSTSAAAIDATTTIDAVSSLPTSDSAHLIVPGYYGKIFFFDIAAMEYQTDYLDGAPTSITSAFSTSSNGVTLSDQEGSVLRNYKVEASSPGDPSSAGASSALAVFFFFAFVLLVA